MKNKKQSSLKVWNLLSGIVALLLLGCEGWAFWRLIRLAVLPGKFLAILIGVAAVITVLLLVMMFPKVGRHQKKKGTGRRITAYLLSGVIAAAAALGGMALSKLNQTFDTITQSPTVSAYVGVYVRSDDPAQEIGDASGYTFAVTDSYDAEHSRATVDHLSQLWNAPVQTESFPSVFAMVDALRDGGVQAMILNEAYLSVLETVDGYTDFRESFRQLYQDTVTTDQIPTTAPVTEPEEAETEPVETTEPEDPHTAPFLAYLSGSDTRSYMLAQSRSDVNILAVVNPETRQILLVNTPRDYYIPNPAYGGSNDKLTHCGLNGPENSAKALGDLYGQKVTYTAQINFTGFETLIDSIGGITIYSDYDDGVFLRAGENHMDGEQALNFARDRHDYAGGDNARGQHQMMVIKAVVDKLVSGSIIKNYSSILDSLQGMFVTSMPSERISELIKMQLEDMKPWNVMSYAVTGTGGSDIPAAMYPLYAYVMYPNMDTVEQASDLMDRVLHDEILTPEDLQPAA